MFQGINWIDLDCTITNKWSDVVVLQSNVFCEWSKIWVLSHFDAAAIIFSDRAEENRVIFSHGHKFLPMLSKRIVADALIHFGTAASVSSILHIDLMV